MENTSETLMTLEEVCSELMIGRNAVLKAAVIRGVVLRILPAHPNAINHLVAVACRIRDVVENAKDARPFVIECEIANLWCCSVVERAECHLPSMSFLVLLTYI